MAFRRPKPLIIYAGKHTFIPILRGHLWDKQKMVFSVRLPPKRNSIHVNISMTGQRTKLHFHTGDFLIEVTAWEGLTVYPPIFKSNTNLLLVSF